MEFKDWFCLKGRESFTVDPKLNYEDSKFYFGRKEIEKRLKDQIRRSFVEPGVPKMVVYGSFGSGKTQTLYHLDYYLKAECQNVCVQNPETFHLDIEMRSKSDHSDWHLQLMETIGLETVSQWVGNLFEKVKDLGDYLKEIFKDLNMVQTIKNLRAGGALQFLAWRWLCGQKLTPTDLERLRVTRNIGDLGAGDMVNVLVGIGKLAAESSEKIIIFIDEAEQFRNVKTGDAVESLHDYLRKLSEPSNSSIGFVIGYYALTQDDMAELLIRQDIRTRIGDINYIEIPPLPSVNDVKIFVKELLMEFIDQKKAEKLIKEKALGISLETFPLSSDSFDLLCEYASQDPVKALPRNLIKAINECAISAWYDKKNIIDEEIVNEIAPLIFG